MRHGMRERAVAVGGELRAGAATGPGAADPGDVRASARLAEKMGLDSIWSTDHLVGSAPMLDSAVVLATAAAVTDRITIGFGVMP